MSEPKPPAARPNTGSRSVVAAFLWGLSEGTFFFVVPDVVISLAALLNPRRAWRHIGAAIAGSVLAGALMFGWAARDPRAAHAAVARVPFVTLRMFDQVHASYRRHGVGAVFLGPLSGIPYKIYAIEAPQFFGAGPFLAATIPARGERFVAVWIFFGVIGAGLRRFGGTAPQLRMVYAALWIAFYAFYWGRIVLR